MITTPAATRRLDGLIRLHGWLFFAIMFYRSFLPNGVMPMPGIPAHAAPAPEPGDPVPAPDPMTAQEWEACCDATAGQDEPPDPGEDEEEPDPEPGECLSGTAGFAAGGVLDGLPGSGSWRLPSALLAMTRVWIQVRRRFGR